MNAAVGLMDGLGLDGDRCIHVIPRQQPCLFLIQLFNGTSQNKRDVITTEIPIPVDDCERFGAING